MTSGGSGEQLLTRLERMLADSRSTEELIAAAIEDLYRKDLNPSDGAQIGHCDPAVSILQARGNREILAAAVALSNSVVPGERVLAAQIVGELGTPDRSFPEECCDCLLRLLEQEDSTEVVEAALFALGHLGNRRSDSEVVKFATHEDDHVRHAAAFALAGTTLPAAVQALLELMCDPYEMVRDWATTSIGQAVELDGPDIRDALFARASDSDRSTRAEAHMGLARRRDERLVPYLIEELTLQSAQPRVERNENYDDYFRDAAKIYLGLNEAAEVDADNLAAALRRFASSAD